MAFWGDVLNELSGWKNPDGTSVAPLTIGQIREKYLKRLSEYTKRNVIAYYSGWLKNAMRPNQDICDSDMTGFMQCMQGIDCKNGLDLILHTPGGSPTAAEGIVNYLHAKFGDDIRIVVPQMAMSAGTMLACAGKSILMGKQSCLGPIDPQYSGVPAYNIMAEYQEAKHDLDTNPGSKTYWEMQLSRYPRAFYYTVCDAIALSQTLAGEWLRKYMFKSLPAEEAKKRIRSILSRLNNNNKSHSRHFGLSTCQELGLEIEEMEHDDELQDAVLSVHHAFTITFDQGNNTKIIMNQNGAGYFVTSEK